MTRATGYSLEDARRVAAFTRGVEQAPKGRVPRRGWRPTATVTRHVFVYDATAVGGLYHANIGDYVQGAGQLEGFLVGSAGECWARPLNGEELGSAWFRGLLIGEANDVPVFGVHCCQTESPGSGSGGGGTGDPLSCCGEGILDVPTLTAVRTRGATVCTSTLYSTGFKTVTGVYSIVTLGGGVDGRADLTGYWWEEDATEYAAGCEADFPGGRLAVVAATGWAPTIGGAQVNFPPPSWFSCVMDFVLDEVTFPGLTVGTGPSYLAGASQRCLMTSAAIVPGGGGFPSVRDYSVEIS